jgi:hypothetical protein
MANTTALIKEIYPYVLKEVVLKTTIKLSQKKLRIGDGDREKRFDGVSDDGETILSIFTSSGYSKSGKSPTGKINALYACCYMMNLTKATRKILAFTNYEFMEIIQQKACGFLPGFELIYIELPEDLKEITEDVQRIASIEMN